MYSDFLELPSTDCLSFTDHSSSYDTAEINEMNNQTNFDYFFDSYYSSLSQYDPGFELPKDYRDMSFSELFDQELFSTHENKDCQIKIKIEKEESLNPCYSADNSQDTSDINSLINAEENVSSSSLSKMFAPKKGINRTFIKNTENHDVNHFILNPFCETEDLDNNQTSTSLILKCEPEDTNETIEENIDMEVEPYYPIDYLQDTSKLQSSVNTKDNVSSTLITSLIPKNNRTNIKTSYNVNHPMYNPFCKSEDLGKNLMSPNDTITLIKQEPEDIYDSTIIQNIEMGLKYPYSTDNSSNIIMNSHSFKQIKDDYKPSILNKSITTCKDINRTTTNYDDNVASNNCKLEVLGTNQMSATDKIPIIKYEPKDVDDIINQNISEMQVKHPYSTDNSSSTITDGHKCKKIKVNAIPSILNKSITKQQDINKSNLKTTNYDVEHVAYNNCKIKVLDINQMSVNDKISIIKRKPENVNNTINQNVIKMQVKHPYSTNDSSNAIIDNHRFKKIKDNAIPSILNKSIKKRQDINKSHLKTTNYDVERVMYNNCKIKVINIDKMSANDKIPIIKCESKDVDNIIDQNVIKVQDKRPHSIDNSSNIINSHKVKQIKNVFPSILNKAVTKRQGVNTTSKETINEHVGYNNCKIKVLGIDQISVNNKIPIIKCEPEDVNDKIPIIKCKPEDDNKTIGQNILMGIKPYSIDKSPKTMIDSHSFVKMKDNVLTLLPQNFIIKRRGNYMTSTKNAKNCDVQNFMNNNLYKTNIGINQMPVKVKTTNVKCEPEEVNDTIEQTIIETKIINGEENHNYVHKEEIKHPSDYSFVDYNNTNIEIQKEINIKKENIVPNVTSLKKDVVSQMYTIKNEINLETEKKKISWEEFRAKRGKMGLLKSSDANEETATDNGKLEAVIKEFDRNTAEHFVGQNRKIEEINTEIAQEIFSDADQELQKKRMKIEYIKKLLPSSFASEIAKTSSLMKGSLVENIENGNTSDDSVMSSDKTYKKQYSDIHDDSEYLPKDDTYKKKNTQTRIYSSHRNSSRTDYSSKSRSSSSSISSNSDDYYNRRIDNSQQGGHYGQNTRNIVPRHNGQKRVVYVGQIPIRFGKRYLYNRFKMFGQIQSLTLHKKPDFRVYYAFVTYSEKLEADRAINHGNDDKTQVQLDIRFGERKQAQTPYYDLDDEWLTDWYGYNRPVKVVTTHSPEKASFEEELQEFYKLSQINKLNQKSSQDS